jgi:hypothetical protein
MRLASTAAISSASVFTGSAASAVPAMCRHVDERVMGQGDAGFAVYPVQRVRFLCRGGFCTKSISSGLRRNEGFIVFEQIALHWLK